MEFHLAEHGNITENKCSLGEHRKQSYYKSSSDTGLNGPNINSPTCVFYATPPMRDFKDTEEREALKAATILTSKITEELSRSFSKHNDGLLPNESAKKTLRHKIFRQNLASRYRELYQSGKMVVNQAQSSIKVSQSGKRSPLSSKVTSVPVASNIKSTPLPTNRKINYTPEKPTTATTSGRPPNQALCFLKLNCNNAIGLNRRLKKSSIINKKLAFHFSAKPKKDDRPGMLKARQSLSLPVTLSSNSNIISSKNKVRNANVSRKLASVNGKTGSKFEKLNTLKGAGNLNNGIGKRFLSQNPNRGSKESSLHRRKVRWLNNRGRKSFSLPTSLESVPSLLTHSPNEHVAEGRLRAATTSKPPISGRSRQMQAGIFVKEPGNKQAITEDRQNVLRTQFKNSLKENPGVKTSLNNANLERNLQRFNHSPFKPSFQDSMSKFKAQSGNILIYKKANLSTNQREQYSSSSGRTRLRTGTISKSQIQNRHGLAKNNEKPALLLKFQTERWRINTSGSEMHEYGLTDTPSSDKRDCFAAWELTQHEVLQSCQSEDMLIMQNALSRSSPHTYHENSTVQRRKKNRMYKSYESYDELHYLPETCEIINLPSNRNRHSLIFSSNNYSIPSKESKTHSVYTTSVDNSSSDKWSVTSSTCSSLSPVKSKKSQIFKDMGFKDISQRNKLNFSENHLPLQKTVSKYPDEYPINSNQDPENKNSQMPAKCYYLKGGAEQKIHSTQILMRVQKEQELKATRDYLQMEKYSDNEAKELLSDRSEGQQQESSKSSFFLKPSCNLGLNRTRSLEIKQLRENEKRSSKGAPPLQSSQFEAITASNETLDKIISIADSKDTTGPVISSVERVKKLFMYSKDQIEYSYSSDTSRSVIQDSQEFSSMSARFIKTKTRRVVSDARKCVLINNGRRKTPLSVWKWRILCVIFVLILGMCHYLAFLATTATV